jgi:YcxB-like protein
MHLGEKESVNRPAHLTRNMARVKVRLAILAPGFISPMSSVVTITFRYRPGEYVRAVNAHQLARARLVPDAAFSLVFLAAGLAMLAFGDRSNFWLSVALCAIGLALPLTFAILLLVLPRLMIAGNGKLRDEYQLTFSDAGIHFRTTAIDSRLAWSLYQSVTEVRDFYLLYYGQRQFTVIPKRAFANETDRQAFETLLLTHVPKIEREA